MDSREIIRNLNALIQLDIDACFAYDQAAEGVEEEQIKEKLRTFKGDHEHHVTILSDHVRQHGGTPPEFTRDFKGFLIEGMTAIRRLAGSRGALNAMETNERVTNKTYEKHCGYDYPEKIRRDVETFFGDERRHLEYVRQMLHLLQAGEPAERRICHVVSHEPEGWWVETEQGQAPTDKLATKGEAIDRARAIAQAVGEGKVIVHRRDGSVEAEYNFTEGPEQ